MAVRSYISGSRLLLNGLSPQPIPTDQSIRIHWTTCLKFFFSFLGLFYSFHKNKKLCRRIRTLFRRENSIWKLNFFTTTLHVPVDFLPKNRKTVIFEFSNRVFSARKGSNWKKIFYKVVYFCDTNKISTKNKHIFWGKLPIVMYYFDWNFWLYMSGYKHPCKRTNV
jgi:hypothetical protein